MLTLAALFTRLWNLGYPNDIVFDEVYFREFASNYLSGQYFMDIHPPLVKLLVAGIGGIFGFTPEQIASGDEATTALRILPALAGALLVPLVYIIVRQLGASRHMATLGGLLVLLDGALLVESRFVLMDSMLLLFGLGAVSCYLAMRKAEGSVRWAWLIALSACAGVVASTKWSGLAVIFVLALAWLVEGILHKSKWKSMLAEFAVVAGVVAAIYASCFALHFALLPKSGEGDSFMSIHFQSTLVGNRYHDVLRPANYWDKLIETNGVMYGSQSSLEAVGHPYSSKWFTWPMMARTVYYWQGDEVNGKQGHIYLLGNPVVWWGTTSMVLTAVAMLALGHRLIRRRRRVLLFLVAGYAVNLLPFALINRPMFLYHYFFALLFAILISCVLGGILLDELAKRKGKRLANHVYWAIAIIVFASFLYFLPVFYGWPLTLVELERYMWLPSWR